jgi:hypothetical protein
MTRTGDVTLDGLDPINQKPKVAPHANDIGHNQPTEDRTEGYKPFRHGLAINLDWRASGSAMLDY